MSYYGGYSKRVVLAILLTSFGIEIPAPSIKHDFVPREDSEDRCGFVTDPRYNSTSFDAETCDAPRSRHRPTQRTEGGNDAANG